MAAIRGFGTRLLVLLFGADTIQGDPISPFRLGRGDLGRPGRRIGAIGLPIVMMMMEGGYAIADRGGNVGVFITG